MKKIKFTSSEISTIYQMLVYGTQMTENEKCAEGEVSVKHYIKGLLEEIADTCLYCTDNKIDIQEPSTVIELHLRFDEMGLVLQMCILTLVNIKEIHNTEATEDSMNIFDDCLSIKKKIADKFVECDKLILKHS